jgi:hypothetical protein
MARDKKTAQKQKAGKDAAAAAAVKAEPKKGKKAKQGTYDSLRDPLDRCGTHQARACSASNHDQRTTDVQQLLIKLNQCC